MSDKEIMGSSFEYKSNSLKIDNLNINVKSCFYSEKKLYDILFSLVSKKIKEKSTQ